jgi:hypothetical protein
MKNSFLLLILFVTFVILIVIFQIFIYSKQGSTSKNIILNNISEQILKTNDQNTISLNNNQKKIFRDLYNSNKEVQNILNSEIIDCANNFSNDLPNPIQIITSQGRLNNDSERIATHESIKDAKKTYCFAFAYILTLNHDYLLKAENFLVKWSEISKSEGRPIDDTLFEDFVTSYDLIKNDLNQDSKNKINTWFRQIADSEIESYNEDTPSNRINNHNSHRMKMIGLIGFTLNDKKYIDYSVNGYKHQIKNDLNSDGSSFDFYARDALYYHRYTLEPLLTLAKAAKLNNIDLYDYSVENKSLQKSVDFLVPYILGDKTHHEWLNSTVAFDRIRANSGDSTFVPGILFSPDQGLKTIEIDYFFRSQDLYIIQKLKNSNGEYPDSFVIIESVQKE